MREVYTIFELSDKQLSRCFSSVVTQLLTPPVRNGRGFFFLSAMSNLGQEVIPNFLKIYGGGCDYHEGGYGLEVKYYKSAENRWGIVFI